MKPISCCDFLQALLTHTKAVLSKALSVWPKAAVKVNYISKLLQNNAHHNLDPPPTLLTGLDVMSTLVDLQPQKMIQVRLTAFPLMKHQGLKCEGRGSL